MVLQWEGMTMKIRILRITFLVAVLTLNWTLQIVSAQESTLISNATLTTLGPGAAYAVNDFGQVVGQRGYHAVQWNADWSMRDLGALGVNGYSIAYGINNEGEVVGVSSYDGGGIYAFLWTNAGGMVDILESRVTSSHTGGINNLGQIVGEFHFPGTNLIGAFLWTRGTGTGTMSYLGTLGGRTSSSAYDINDASQVVGWAMLPNYDNHAVLWTAATGTFVIQDLGTLGGNSSSATGINNLGHVVGWSTTASGATHAFLWKPDTGMIDLDPLGNYSYAQAINDKGQVVINEYNIAFGYTAFLWTAEDGMKELPPISGFESRAYDINNNGLIAGVISTTTGTNLSLAALWIIPEIATVSTGTNVVAAPNQQVQLTFETVVSGGSVTAVLVLPGGLPASPNFAILGGTSYNITKDDSLIFDGQVTVCISYDPTKIIVAEPQLRLYHYSSGTWTDITLLPVDTVNKKVCGLTSSFSVFGVAEPKNVFQGFFSPVDNPPVVNNAKAGQTIPVKWRITDANGVPVSDPASFKSLTSYLINCGNLSGEPTDAVEEYVAGSAGLQYSGDGYWQFNWKTPKTYAGRCGKMVLTLGDVAHEADFKFR
jgi:probable HAF family extracellular repeat protein